MASNLSTARSFNSNLHIQISLCLSCALLFIYSLSVFLSIFLFRFLYMYRSNQVTLRNQDSAVSLFSLFTALLFCPFFFIPSFLSYFSPLFSISLPVFSFNTERGLRTFYGIQNINLSSRSVITLSSRAAALFLHGGVFFFSSIYFHFTHLIPFLPPFFLPLLTIG